MTLEASDLERIFEREHRFRAALLSAAKAAEPKTSIWPSVAKLLVKAIPADLVRTVIVDGGKAILAKRPAAEDQPPEPQEPKKPPVPRSTEDGRPKKDIRSAVTFVSTFVEPEKPVPKPE